MEAALESYKNRIPFVQPHQLFGFALLNCYLRCCSGASLTECLVLSCNCEVFKGKMFDQSREHLSTHNKAFEAHEHEVGTCPHLSYLELFSPNLYQHSAHSSVAVPPIAPDSLHSTAHCITPVLTVPKYLVQM